MATQDRLPTGDGALNAWEPGSTYARWEACDDPIGSPDGDLTFIHTGLAGADQLFTFAAFNFAASEILHVTVELFGKTEGITPQVIKPSIRVNGVVYAGAGSAFGTSAYESGATVWTENPATALAWTLADVLGTGSNPLQQFGCRSGTLAMGHTVRVTQVYGTAAFIEDSTGQPMMLRATTVPRLRPWHPSFNR